MPTAQEAANHPASENPAAESLRLKPRPRIYRGIVVVHGVGEHKKGSYASGFIEELAKFVHDAGDLGATGKVQLTARNRTDTTATTWATIHIKNPDLPDEEQGAAEEAANPTRDAPGPKDEEWHVREAWWTRTFEPSKPGRIYLWGILAGLALIWAAAVHQGARGVLSWFDRRRLNKWPTERLGRPIDRDTHEVLPEDSQGVWRQPEASKAKSIRDLVVWVVFSFGYAVAGIFGLPVIGLVYLVFVLPLSFFLPAAANRILKAVMGFIVHFFGDQEAMTTRQFALASAANEVNTALWNMLSEDGMRNHRDRDPQFEGFESITVVAHSGGCVVSLAALKSADLARFNTERATFTRGGKSVPFHRPKRLTWITAGSGLNLAFSVRFGDKGADTALWAEKLKNVNWLNFYARYDPIVQGPAPAKMVRSLLGPDPEVPTDGEQAVARPPFVALRVVNTDSPWADHGGYWSNHPEVMSRVVHVVTEERLATEAINPLDMSVAEKNLKPLKPAIETAVDRIAARRNRVSWSVFNLLVALAGFVLVTLWIGDDLGRWVLGQDNFHFLKQWSPAGKKLENVLSWNAHGHTWWQRYRLSELFVGGAVLAVLAMVALQYRNLSQWLWRFANSEFAKSRRGLWLFATSVILVATLVVSFLLLVVWPTGTPVEWPWDWNWEWPWQWDAHW